MIFVASSLLLNKKFKIDESIDNNSLDGVKQDIINFYLIEKQKYEEKKKEIETTKKCEF